MNCSIRYLAVWILELLFVGFRGTAIRFKRIPIFMLILCSTSVLAEPIDRLLILGNSITWHTPSKDLGWSGNWGMAATTQDNDFSHLLAAMLEKAQDGRRPILYPRNISEMERNPERYDFDRLSFVESFRPDVVIIFLGDNVNLGGTDGNTFGRQYGKLLSKLNNGTAKRIYCVSTWWMNRKVDGYISSICDSNRGIYVSLDGLSIQPGMKANLSGKFSNAGVADHPSDQGMEAIANRLMSALMRPRH